MAAAPGFPERVVATLYALDGQTYVTPAGVRVEVVNIRLVKTVLRALFALALLAAVGLWLAQHRLLILAILPATAALVAATLLWLPSIRTSDAGQEPERLRRGG